MLTLSDSFLIWGMECKTSIPPLDRHERYLSSSAVSDFSALMDAKKSVCLHQTGCYLCGHHLHTFCLPCSSNRELFKNLLFSKLFVHKQCSQCSCSCVETLAKTSKVSCCVEPLTISKIPQGKHKLVQRGWSLSGINMELASDLHQCLTMMRLESWTRKHAKG